MSSRPPRVETSRSSHGANAHGPRAATLVRKSGQTARRSESGAKSAPSVRRSRAVE